MKHQREEEIEEGKEIKNDKKGNKENKDKKISKHEPSQKNEQEVYKLQSKDICEANQIIGEKSINKSDINKFGNSSRKIPYDDFENTYFH